MPYTPPSHRSPASSATASPDVSRRSSITSGQKPSLPRSASYLNKHRRTPSATPAAETHSTPSPPYGSSDEVKNAGAAAAPVSASLRKSPPPVTDDRGIPNAAIISPPDSASSDSEDEGRPEIRGRKLGKLRDAVSQIPQPRTPSPPSKESRLSRDDVTPRSIIHTSFSAMTLSELPKSGRRMGHVRSATDPNASAIMTSAENSQTVSEDSEDDMRPKPPMVRKKSGELVRPALRGNKRPSSMPGTPVFAKAVHFDSHLEHIRHFLQVDRPLAVSAGSSPVENYDSDAEYPFPGGEKRGPGARSPPFDWQLITNNFPHDSPVRREQPVRLEKVWLSPDQKSMLGSVAVSNLSFQKSVVCRFTLDYWKTTSEVAAEFSHEIRPRVTRVSQDRFTFSIKLSDTINLELKTLYFCIRYNVNGQEYWDNNGSANFQVDFRKQFKPQNGKNGFSGAASRSANSLPRSNRKQNPAAGARPAQMPLSFEGFDKNSKFKFDDHINDFLGESNTPGLRLKTKSTSNLASDNITKGLGLTAPSGLAFANRYDFGASLSAAVQAAKDSAAKDKDALYMKRNIRDSPTLMTFGPPLSAPPASQSSPPASASAPATAAAPSPNVGLGLGLASSSYEELVSKYCFFGSKQSTAAATNGSTRSDENELVSQGSVSDMTAYHGPLHHAGPAAHHSLHHSLHQPIDMKLTRPLTADYLAASNSSPLDSISSVLISRDQSSAPKSMPHMRSPSPSFSTSPTDAPFFAQQMIQQRFRWGGEPHTATAIRG
jgi:hypothetical protein